MLTISIALATFNGSRYLREQLKSLAEQICLPDELVVTDDCSTDDTLQIVAEFAAQAPFKVRAVKNDSRLGYRDNFMKAAALCSNPIIAFCDQDDIWHKDKLSDVVKQFEDPAVMLVHHNANLIDAGGKFLKLALEPRMLAEKLAPRYFAMGFTEIFRRELLAFSDLYNLSIDHQEPKEKMAHDKWVFFLAASLGKIVYLERPLVDYRQHPRNTYGFKPDNIWKRTTKKLTQSVETFPVVGLFAERSAEILSAASRRCADREDLRSRLVQRSDRFGRLANWYGLRSEVYGGSHVFQRAGSWSRLVLSGGYKPGDPWSFGLQNLLADASLGVACGFLFKKLQRARLSRPGMAEANSGD